MAPSWPKSPKNMTIHPQGWNDQHRGSPVTLQLFLSVTGMVWQPEGMTLLNCICYRNTSLCTQCTVRPNNTKAFGAEKGFLQGHARRWMAQAPQTPWELSAKPFSREEEGGASALLPTFWWQSLCSWGQVTVRERCSCKPPPSDYYSLFWQEKTRSPGTTVTLWGPALAGIGQISAGGSLRARSPDPVQPPSLRKLGAQDATSAQAPQAAWMAGEGRAGPADADPGRRPLPWGCRCRGEGHLKAWAWPVGGTWWGLWSLQDTAPNLFLGPSVHLPAGGQMSWRAPGRGPGSASYLTLPPDDHHSPTNSPMTLCWAGPLTVAHWQLLAWGRGHYDAGQWLSETTNGRSWTVGCLGEGPTLVPDQWLNRTTKGPPPPAPHPTAPLLPANGLGETVQSDPDDSVALN